MVDFSRVHILKKKRNSFLITDYKFHHERANVTDT